MSVARAMPTSESARTISQISSMVIPCVAPIRPGIKPLHAKPGMKQSAASGQVSIEAHSVEMGIMAQKVMSLISEADWVSIKGKKGGSPARRQLHAQAGTRVLKLKLQPPNSTGDETVPSDRSAKHIPGKKFIHGEKGDWI